MIVNIYRIVPDGKKKQLRTTARESFRFQSSAKKLKSRTICANVYTCILYPKYAVTNSSIASIETLSTNSFLKILCIYHFYSDPIQNLTFLDTIRSFYWNGLFIQCSYIYLKSIANLSSVLLVNLVWCNYKKESSRFITSRHIIWRLEKLSIKHGLQYFMHQLICFQIHMQGFKTIKKVCDILHSKSTINQK